MNVTEYLEQLFASGIQPGDLPAIQPLFQQRIWQQMAPGDGPERLAVVIDQLRHKDSRFHVEGGSRTAPGQSAAPFRIRQELASACRDQRLPDLAVTPILPSKRRSPGRLRRPTGRGCSREQG